jgi:hypothetical protein
MFLTVFTTEENALEGISSTVVTLNFAHMRVWPLTLPGGSKTQISWARERNAKTISGECDINSTFAHHANDFENAT